MSILQLNQLEVGYQSTILGPTTLEVPAASFVLIEGPNGIGKSTLLKTLIGLARPRAGTCRGSCAAMPASQLNHAAFPVVHNSRTIR